MNMAPECLAGHGIPRLNREYALDPLQCCLLGAWNILATTERQKCIRLAHWNNRGEPTNRGPERTLSPRLPHSDGLGHESTLQSRSGPSVEELRELCGIEERFSHTNRQ